jgi:AraC-like DNA-binding protein
MGLYRQTRLNWRDWNPGLDNDHIHLGEYLQSLPAASPNAIPRIIRLVENPASRLALPGAITLARHDAIHVLLGRGLLLQDEAFVIGFTMGCDSAIRPRHRNLFRWISTRLYPKPYRMSKADMLAYNLGFDYGLDQHHRDIHEFPFESHLDWSLKDLRTHLGLSVHRLHALFNYEKLLLPGTATSQRLDLDWKGTDPSDLYPPHGF